MTCPTCGRAACAHLVRILADYPTDADVARDEQAREHANADADADYAARLDRQRPTA